MQRIRHQWQAERISFVLSLLDPDLAEVIESSVDFFVTDPLFAGLHDIEDADDGRSYRNTAHACYPYHQASSLPASDRKATVILPESSAWAWTVPVILHEIGHIIHYTWDFEDFDLPVVSEYAATNWCEKFAEAFTAYYLPPEWGYRDEKTALSLDHIELLNDIAGYSPVWER